MLDAEGKQRVDPDGKLMFNPPVQQIRDKKGHPVFDADGKPVFQTAGDMGYDEKGKKITVKKEKPPKMTPVSISAGTLTVDGWTGKAQLNYDIADLKYLYIYAPGIGTTIVSLNPFPGAKEQPGAFNDKTLTITVDGHPIQLYSEKRLLGKKPESAWVSVDRSFMLPAKFPVFGYGPLVKAPYAWPGSKEAVAAKGAIQAPPLPKDVTPDAAAYAVSCRNDASGWAGCVAGPKGGRAAVRADTVGSYTASAVAEASRAVAARLRNKGHEENSWPLCLENGLGGAGDFVQACSLAAQTAQVEQLGAPNLVGAELLDLVDDLGVEGEDALDALAEAHLAHGEGALRPTVGCDNHAFKGLEAFFLAFANLDLHAYGVAGAKRGVVGPLKFGGQFLHNRMNRHRYFPVRDSNP